MIRTDGLNLIADDRVTGLSQAAVNQLVRLLTDHLKRHASLDRDTFLMLASEAEAVTA